MHPTYFPSVAHFAAMMQYNIVFEVQDNYQKQTYRNRAYIYSPSGKQLLTVPVKHTGKDGHQQYKEVKIEYAFNWPKQHWKTLETAYRSSPFFEFYEDDILPVFEKKHTCLIDLAMETIALVCGCLHIDVPAESTADYSEGVGNMLDMRYLTDAKKGPGFNFEAYRQVFGEKFGFISNLSILDLLFNEGPGAVAYLARQNLSSASTGK